jgi:hypothetical protein
MRLAFATAHSVFLAAKRRQIKAEAHLDVDFPKTGEIEYAGDFSNFGKTCRKLFQLPSAHENTHFHRSIHGPVAL